MLGQSEIMAFVATARPAAALAFYRDVLGLALVEDSPFALVFSGGGTMLRVQKVEAVTPVAHTSLGWVVDDIAAMIDALVARGVEFSRFAGLEQDARGVWTSPPGHQVAWFRDPDGNTLSLTQFARDPHG